MTAPRPIDPTIDESWKRALADEFQQPYFQALRRFLKQEKAGPYPVYPPGPQIFSAFDRTPLDRVKVVIIGQDPYHGPGQANGLCFSVAKGVRHPPSLRNIFTEIEQDLGVPVPEHGDLGRWADQGVLLLNATLTVRARAAASHQGRGWETFTDAVIRTVSEQREGIVFLLWGRFARAKKALIDTDKHHVLEAAHPSPFSADKGFFGCRHFSRANALLAADGREPIDWSLG